MKRTVLSLLAALFVVTFTAGTAKAQDAATDKHWEYSLSVGYKTFPDLEIDNAVDLSVRLSNRVGYPILLGFEAEWAYVDEIHYTRLGIPIGFRTSFLFPRTKADLSVSPGFIYVVNNDTKVSDTSGAVTFGVEVKHFLKPGFSIGVGASYTAASVKGLDTYNLVAVFGF